MDNSAWHDRLDDMSRDEVHAFLDGLRMATQLNLETMNGLEIAYNNIVPEDIDNPVELLAFEFGRRASLQLVTQMRDMNLEILADITSVQNEGDTNA